MSEFLAHLSQRLTRWAYSIPMSIVVVHTFKLEYLWSQLANLDQILCVASLGWGKGCIRLSGRLDQNSGFHSNRKPPLAYNGENDVSTFSRLFLIRSILYPPQNLVLVGYTVFSMSVILWVCQHWRYLLDSFDSFCRILFRFTLHLNHHHVW